MAYTEFICDWIRRKPVCAPIFTSQIADALVEEYCMTKPKATAATAVAVKRIMDGKLIPTLRFYQKGIYYLTVNTPFGERGIDVEQLIADKYLLPDVGYETGLTLLHRMGLATEMPKEVLIATNVAKDCVRADTKLGVMIRPPKTEINADNKAYLQTLDALELLDKAPIDAERPYEILARHIQTHGLQYGKLLLLADRYYSKKTILQLARTAGEGGIRN